jgi:hypothetical protein
VPECRKRQPIDTHQAATLLATQQFFEQVFAIHLTPPYGWALGCTGQR